MALNLQKGTRARGQILFVGVILVVLIVAHIITGGRFLRPSNLVYVVTHSVFYIFVAWGMMFIFTPGIMDLSVGANVILAANLGAICAMDFGLGYPGLILVTIISATCFEILSVGVSVKLRIPSWVSGLGMTLIYEAILNVYAAVRAQTAGSNVITLDRSLRFFGETPVMIAVLVIGFVACYILFNKTSLGYNITAVGGNREVAGAMGINITKTIFLGALVGGIFLGVSGLVRESEVGRLFPQVGMASLSTIFRSLAILLLGQSFTKLFSMPTSVLICGILVNGLFNFLTLIRVPSGTGQEMCLGALVIVCGILSHLNEKGVVK